MPNNARPPPCSLHLLLLPLFLSSTTITLCDYPATCPTRTCGNITIRYPFWFEDVLQQTKNNPFSFCGYKNFAIYCSGGYPIVNLGQDNHTVTAIDYDQRTVKLTDTDVLTTAGNCPRVRHNATVWDSESQFRYTDGDATLTFFFNCSSPIANLPDLPTVLKPATCFSGVKSDLQSYVLWTDVILWDVFYALKCDELVTVRVLESEQLRDYSWLIGGGFGSALKNGFELGWTQTTADGCDGCEKSGGFCGYSVTSNGSYDFTCYCSDGAYSQNCGTTGNIHHVRKKTVLAICFGIGGLLLSALLIFPYFISYKRNFQGCIFWKEIPNHARAIESFLEKYDYLAPKRYTYAEVKKMTKSFQEKLGQGGFGFVFKGTLPNGREVAVKILNISTENGEDFVNEVAGIGKTSHVNVVTLRGFCSEGSKRALVYDFMPNGSLDKHIRHAKLAKVPYLSCEKLYDIAVGIARGLEYLHRGSNARMVHFDIKPHNILLDQNFCPKISDFGLAKLCSSKGSIVSINGTRGTPGYIAPEVFSRSFGVVSSKSDVYSYGMMILEIFGAQDKSVMNNVEEGSEDYFPDSIYRTLVESHDISSQLVANVSNKIIRKMLLVGIWCIQTTPENRPSMNRVIEMLEGDGKDLPLPPKPSLISSHIKSDIL